MPDVPEVSSGDPAGDASGDRTGGSARSGDAVAAGTDSAGGGPEPDPLRPAEAAPPPSGTEFSGTPPFGTPPSGTPPFGTPPAGTPPVGTPPAGTPPFGTPPLGGTGAEGNAPSAGPVPGAPPGSGSPWGAPPWGAPTWGGPPWGGPPQWSGWGPGWPASPPGWSPFPPGWSPSTAGPPSSSASSPRRPLSWLVIGGVLGAIAMVAIGLGIGFSVWGGSAPVADRGGAAFPAPRIGPGIGSGGFLGVEVGPSGFVPAPTAPTRSSTTPSTSPGTPSGPPAAPSTPGAHVVSVVPSSPAAKAGIEKGDTITEFATRPVRSALTLRIDVLGMAPGSRVKVGWVTPAGKHESATVTLARRPATRRLG